MTSIKRLTGGLAALVAALAIGALPMTAQAMGPPGPEDIKAGSGERIAGTAGTTRATSKSVDRDEIIDELP